MTRILIFEWMMGGGLWIDNQLPDPDCPFQSQGRSMLEALARDLDQLGCQIQVPVDHRLSWSGRGQVAVESAEGCRTAVVELADQVDWILLIAPESGGCLLDVLSWIEAQSEKLVSPDREFVQLASSKHLTAQRLEAAGVPVPRGERIDWRAPPSLIGKVIKPDDGAGSEDVRLCDDRFSIEQLSTDRCWRVEEFVAGTPVSVSILCGKGKSILLPPTQQQFRTQPFGVYESASFSLKADMVKRAHQLARQAIDALPATHGYVGIDMVLGSNGDFVIEVNPRLTVSYVHLSRQLGLSVARQMMQLAKRRR